MERKNDSTILLLVAAGLGIYWFMKNKSMPPATTTPTLVTNLPLDQTVISTQPVYEAPVYQQPVYEAPVYQQPVYEAPVYQQPVQNVPVVDQPVISTQPVYEAPVYTPISDMMNSFTSGGGLTNNVIDYNQMTNSPSSALKDEYL
jgi:septal ring-binding cell division protein DamX